MQRHLYFARCLLLIASVCITLTSCGGPAALTPEQVHAQYVQALVKKDRQTAFDLTVPQQQITVDSTLERFRDIRIGTGFYGYTKETQGEFVEAEPFALVDDGEGKMGMSLWQWERAHICYQVFLAETNDGWKVTKWYQAGDKEIAMHPQCAQPPTP